jgi:bacteriocin biosynthesis cyclodehydratase domain-containing protein
MPGTAGTQGADVNRAPAPAETRAIALAARLARVELPARPRLAPWATAVELGDERLQLRGAELTYTLRHPFLTGVYRTIAPLLDGSRTLEEIAQAGGPDVDDATVVFLLKLLQAHGFLQPGGDGATSPEALAPWERQLRFIAHFVPDAAAAQAALLGARVTVFGDAGLSAAVAAALGSVGVAALEPSAAGAVPAQADLAEADLAIACQESPGFAFFDAVNRACLESGTRWLRLAVVGTSGQLGPTIVPYQTCCYTCLDLRARSHEPEPEAFAAYRRHPGPVDEGALAPLSAGLAAEAALEAARLLTGFAPPVTIGRFYELDARSPARLAHEVLKVPRCPSCGAGEPPRGAWDIIVAGNGAP